MPDPYRLVPIGDLLPDPSQPRKEFDGDAIQRLADSMKSRGVLMPLRVLWDDEREKFLIIAGESRFRAALLAKLETLPVVVVEGKADEADLLADRICENSVRSDLSPVDFAHAIARLRRLKSCSATALAAELGLSNAAITRAESLLTLPAEIQALVGNGLCESSAYAVSRLESPQQQFEMVDNIIKQGWSRGLVEEAVKDALPPKKPAGSGSSKLALKLGNLAVDFRGERLKWPEVLAALERLQTVARQLADSNKPLADWAKALKAG